MNKVTQTQKRFLIIWTCFNLFALFVNVARIKGRIQEYRYSSIGSIPADGRREINLFTNGSRIDTDNSIFHPKTFYPFTTEFFSIRHSSNGTVSYSEDTMNFQGIFNGYGYSEFIAYSILGLLIVFLPKLWK